MTGNDDDHETETGTDAENDSEDDTAADSERGGLTSMLRDLVETIAEAGSSEKAVGRGRIDVGRARIGHDFSIGVGTLDDVTDADRRRVGGTGVDAGVNVETGLGATDTTDAAGGTGADTDHPTDVRYDEEESEAIVTIDVSEIDPERLAAGVSSRNGDLLVGTDDTIVERVPHRLTDATLAAASYHNGVLELHLRSDAATDTTGGPGS